MLTQAKVEKAVEGTPDATPKKKAHDLNWSGWTLQLGRNEDGTFGIWTFRGQPVWMVRAGRA